MSCVFIEDTDLLSAASLPFAMEVCRVTNTLRRVDERTVERHLRDHADQVRHAIDRIAGVSRGRWSFETVRRRKVHAVLELVATMDVTMVAPAHVVSARDPGSATQRCVFIVLDRSAASRRVVETARRIAVRRRVPVVGLIVASSEAGSERIAERLERSVGLSDIRLETALRPDFEQITRRARHHGAAAIVLPSSQFGDSGECAQALENGLPGPVVIVR